MPINYIITTVTGDCLNIGTGALYIEPIDGQSPYIIDWQIPNLGTDVSFTSSTRTGLSVGTYQILVTDSSVSPQEQPVLLTISSGICLETSVVNSTCGLPNGVLTATATTSVNIVDYYLYSNTNGYVTSGTSSVGFYPFVQLSADTYYVEAIDDGGCSGRSSTNVVLDSGQLDYGFFVVNNSRCSGPAGKIYITGQTGVSPYTYLWINNETTSSISGLTAGVYTVTVLDSGGCSVTKQATVIDVEPPDITNLLPVSPSCFQADGQITVYLSGGTAPFYYVLSNGDTKIDFSNNTTFTGLSSGIYNVTVTDAGLCTTSGTITLSSPNAFTFVAASSVPSVCGSSNGIINVSVQGGSTPYTYTLTDTSGNTRVISINSNAQFNNLPTGTYHIKITNPSTCSYETDITVINEDAFTISTTYIDTTCGLSNGSIRVETSANGTYTYEIPGQSITLNSTAYTFNNLSSGLYAVSVTDVNGCKQTKSVSIKSSDLVQFSLIDTSCGGTGNEGTITAVITNGTPPFAISWSSNVGSQHGIYVTGLTAGTYSVTVTDSNDCSLTKTTQIICGTSNTSYQIFNICDDIFTERPGTKTGFPQMLNQGYQDLTSGETNCKLTLAQFNLLLNVGSSAFTSNFFATTSLSVYPTDQQYVDALNALLSGVPGIGSIVLNVNTNSISLNTDCARTLSADTVSVAIRIDYDICCYGVPSPSATPTVTPTPTITPTNTPTPTVTITPTKTVTPTITPTPSLPLQSFRMTAVNVSAITITEIQSTSYGYLVDWGDGNVSTFAAGNHAPNHVYSSLYNGLITVKSLDLSDITRFAISTTITGSSGINVVIDTSEYTKLDSLNNSYLNYEVRLDGLISQIPRTPTYLVISQSNLTGNTTDLPPNLLNLQMFNNNGNTVLSGNTSGLPSGLTYVSIYDNIISGNTTGLPSGLIYLNLLGDNTLSGNTSGLPAGTTTLAIAGKNTISGSTSGLPSGLTLCQIYTMDGYFGPGNTISENVSLLPAGITNLLLGGDNTVSGDTLGLPLGLTYLYVTGDNTISGDVADLPNGLTEIYLTGNGTITGNVSFLPPNLTSVTIIGNNTIDGSISDFSSAAFNIAIEGQNTITGYTSPNVWPTTMYQLKIRGNSTISTTNINNILSDLATYSTTWSSTKLVSLKGTQTNPTAVAILTGRTVTVNITP